MQNCAADMLLRNQLTKLLQYYPDSLPLPKPIPSSLIEIILPKQHDWTSPEFLHGFRQLIKTICINALYTYYILYCTLYTIYMYLNLYKMYIIASDTDIYEIIIMHFKACDSIP